MTKNTTTWILIIITVIIIVFIVIRISQKPYQTISDEDGSNVPFSQQVVTKEAETGRVQKLEEVVEQVAVVEDVSAPDLIDTITGIPEELRGVRAIDEEEIVKGAVRLMISNTGFRPREFRVTSGEVITLAITSVDKTHTFMFENPGLRNASLGLSSGEIRQTTFKAPAQGDYTFFCDIPGHRGRGETGVMHVE
ncbi:cupredoxin domain-containing protein [Patescibacteria group bacterium AH-259-L05]|nr:cupredoxin domain-containing protein [Patescibacteria group bacterium AH-259-L05]